MAVDEICGRLLEPASRGRERADVDMERKDEVPERETADWSRRPESTEEMSWRLTAPRTVSTIKLQRTAVRRLSQLLQFRPLLSTE